MIARLSAPAAGAAAVNCASCPTGTSLDDALDFAGAVHDTVRANGSERLAAIVQSDQPVTVLVLGGSMTLGHDASCRSECFRKDDCECAWPKILANVLSGRAQVTSRAVGGSSSKWALYNVASWAQDALRADLVIVDYVVNDAGSWDWGVYHGEDDFVSVTEALIREIRSLPNAPALLVLHTVPASSANCNLDLLRWQRPLLLYYHVPVLSYLRAISAEFDGLGGHARMEWETAPSGAQRDKVRDKVPRLQAQARWELSANRSAALNGRLLRSWGHCPHTYHPAKAVHFAVAKLIAKLWNRLGAVQLQSQARRREAGGGVGGGIAHGYPHVPWLPPPLYGGGNPICRISDKGRPMVSYHADDASRSSDAARGESTSPISPHLGNLTSPREFGESTSPISPHLGNLTSPREFGESMSPISLGTAWQLLEDVPGKRGWILPVAPPAANSKAALEARAAHALRFRMAFSDHPTLAITSLSSYGDMGSYLVCIRLADQACSNTPISSGCQEACSTPVATRWAHRGSLLTTRVFLRHRDMPSRKQWGMNPTGTGAQQQSSSSLSATNILENVSALAEYWVSIRPAASSAGKLKITSAVSC